MLTKEEREEIAERLDSYSKLDYYSFYKAVVGVETTTSIPLSEDVSELKKIVYGLCDTSNMVELPLDKDGEVIRVGDTVYDEAKRKLEVDSIRFYQSNVQVVATMRGEYNNLTYYPSELTHKSPVTAKSLAQSIKYVLENEATSIGVNPYVELGRIAEQLERLGDSDEE